MELRAIYWLEMKPLFVMNLKLMKSSSYSRPSGIPKFDARVSRAVKKQSASVWAGLSCTAVYCDKLLIICLISLSNLKNVLYHD